MKNFYFYFLFLFFCIKNNYAQYTTIPDPNFEQHLIYLGYDNGTPDGQVLTSNINSVTSMIVQPNTSSGQINSLQGIEGFTALETLFVTGLEFLYVLDLSGNLNLKWLEIGQNSFNSINISNNIALEKITGIGGTLPVLNTSNNINLNKIYLINGYLQELDVSNNPLLKNLTLTNNFIESMDVSNNNLLEFLYLGGNSISNIDISNNTLLKGFAIWGSPITELNISNNLLLEVLGIGNTNISTLDVTNHVFLKELYLQNTTINSLNLNNNPNLEKLDCTNSALTSLQIQNGNNALLNGFYTIAQNSSYKRFNATNNPNLSCIFVDDVANCSANWLGVDATSHFVSTQQECSQLANEEFSINIEIKFYPNPVTDILNISLDNYEFQNVVIYDVMGKVILEQKENLKQIDVSNLKKGIYLVKLVTKNGSVSKKIIKG